MARKSKRKSKKRRSGARRRRLLSAYTAPKRRKRKAKKASGGKVRRASRSRISRRAKRRISKRRRSLLSAYGTVKANPGRRRRRRRAHKNPGTKAGARKRARRAKNRVSKRQRRREIAMGNTHARRRRSRKASSRKATTLAKRAKSLRRRAKGRKGVGAPILRTRARALSLHARSLRRRKGKGGLSPTHKKMLRASGLMKVNPSVSAIVKDMAVLMPQVGATIGGMAVTSMGASKLVAMLRAKAPSIPGINSVHAPAVVSAILGAVGYVALRLIGAKPGSLATFLNRLAPGVFVGGMTAAALHTLSAVKDGTGQALGKKVGLPIGDYVVGDYVVGDYVVGAMPGAQATIAVDGARVRLNGLGSIFRDNTLGALPDPREGARGTRYEPHMRELLDVDTPEGNLSGSIFD